MPSKELLYGAGAWLVFVLGAVAEARCARWYGAWNWRRYAYPLGALSPLWLPDGDGNVGSGFELLLELALLPLAPLLRAPLAGVPRGRALGARLGVRQGPPPQLQHAVGQPMPWRCFQIDL